MDESVRHLQDSSFHLAERCQCGGNGWLATKSGEVPQSKH